MVDPFGGGQYDGNDEFEALSKFVPDLLPAGVSGIIRRAHYMNDQSNADLLVYDFGGLMPGADNLIASNARALGRWLQQHPNSLALVISRFTYSRLRSEFQDAGLIPEDETYRSVYDDDSPVTEFKNLLVMSFTVDSGFWDEEQTERVTKWFAQTR